MSNEESETVKYELSTMEKIAELLDPLKPATQSRILHWLQMRAMNKRVPKRPIPFGPIFGDDDLNQG